ncbi:MAG: hypothetical protein V1873_07170 [Verrucomicrobiota bacterium]
MGEAKPVEIICSACGADTLLMRKPKYDGFTKVGESLLCASCGHEYAAEAEVPFKGRPKPQVFTDADKSAKVEVFHEDEKGRICRYCLSYLVNPFTQWCSVHKKEVEATDTCPKFTPRPPPKEEKKPAI